jgi:hypothetical protein
MSTQTPTPAPHPTKAVLRPPHPLWALFLHGLHPLRQVLRWFSLRLTRSALAVLVLTQLLVACAGPQIGDYANEKPALDLRQYFNGPVTGHGLVTDRAGNIVSRFVVKMNCTWDGKQGVLDEDFTYSDGRKERRIWRLTLQDDGSYIGKADDVVGQAVGQVAGNALRWRYTLALPVDGRVWHIDFDDWMVLMDNTTLINKATMSKWGFRVGEVTLSFTKG